MYTHIYTHAHTHAQAVRVNSGMEICTCIRTRTPYREEEWRAPLHLMYMHPSHVLLHFFVLPQVFSFMGFVSAIVWIYVVANEIVALLQVSMQRVTVLSRSK